MYKWWPSGWIITATSIGVAGLAVAFLLGIFLIGLFKPSGEHLLAPVEKNAAANVSDQRVTFTDSTVPPTKKASQVSSVGR